MVCGLTWQAGWTGSGGGRGHTLRGQSWLGPEDGHRLLFLTYEAARVDEELVPSAGREEEGGEDQEHRDEAGQDDAGSVGRRAALEF